MSAEKRILSNFQPALTLELGHIGFYLFSIHMRCMRSFIFGVVLFLLPIVTWAYSCSQKFYGPYSSSQLAYDALTDHVGFVPSTYGFDIHNAFGAYSGNGTWSVQPARSCNQLESIYGGTDSDFVSVAFVYFESCPDGMTATPELGGVCICDNGTINYETMSCEEPEEPRCQSPTTYNGSTKLCEKECPIDKPWDGIARDCAAPPEPQNCSNEAGNPINFFTGHKLQRELVFEASGDFPLTFTWLYNSFGNHRKTGAGYSVGSKILEDGSIALIGETMLHTEPPLTDGAQRISLPLDNDPTANYQGNVIEHWRHNHNYFLAHYTLPDGVTARLIAYRPTGSDLHFVEENGEFVAVANRNWRASKELNENSEQIGWILRVDGRIERYDTVGRILRVENEQGQGISYTYDESGVRQAAIADDNGNSISLSYTDGKLTQMIRNDGAVYQFVYNDNGLLQSITFPGSGTPQRVFRYEDSRFPNALTGVTDEAGKVYSAFTYDDQGRAIRTEHNGSAESIDVEYVNENTRRLTNALGKQTTYHYSDVGGTKRITSVQGEPSANCAAANKSYTYDANGFVASETDWEGNATVYTRDNLGRELTRIEAADTTLERVIITEWHPTLNVPFKVTTPRRIIQYSYDSSGHLIGKLITLVNDL